MRRPFVPRAVLNEELVEPLVRRTLAHDPVTWPQVWLGITPVIEEVAGHWRVTSRLADRDDERRDIVVGVMARLRANDFERLALFHEVLLRRDGSARAWLVQVTTRSAIGHLRGHAENIGDDEWRWAEMVPFPDGDEGLPVSMRAVQMLELRRVEACAQRELDPIEREALTLWLAGHEKGEIAARLGFAGPAVAEGVLRNALKRLRRRLGAG